MKEGDVKYFDFLGCFGIGTHKCGNIGTHGTLRTKRMNRGCCGGWRGSASSFPPGTGDGWSSSGGSWEPRGVGQLLPGLTEMNLPAEIAK